MKINSKEPFSTKEPKKFEFPVYLQNLTCKEKPNGTFVFGKNNEKNEKNAITEEINRLKKHFLQRQV